MSEPIPTNPIAVPWTPDMPAQNAPAPQHAPAPGQQAPVSQPAPVQPRPAPQPQPVQGRPVYQVGPVPAQQSPVIQPAPQARPQQIAPQHAPAYAQQAPVQPQAQAYQPAPAQYAAAHAPQPQPQAQPQQHTHAAQPYAQQAHNQMHQQPTAHMPLNRNQPAAMQPQMQPQVAPAGAAPNIGLADAPQPAKSKSLLNKFKKRAPKVPAASAAMGQAQAHLGQAQAHLSNAAQAPGQIAGQAMGRMRAGAANLSMPSIGAAPQAVSQGVQLVPTPQASGSLFTKNFFLGGALGLLLGAFALPILFNMLNGDSAPQTRAQAEASSAPDAGSDTAQAKGQTEETFLDDAIAADESQD